VVLVTLAARPPRVRRAACHTFPKRKVRQKSRASLVSRHCRLSSPKCGAADLRDLWLADCRRRPRQSRDPADHGPAGGKVHKPDPWQTVMIANRGDDQRRDVDAEHGASTSQKPIRLQMPSTKLSIVSLQPSAGGFPSHLRERSGAVGHAA